MATGTERKPPITVYPLIWENSSPTSSFSAQTIQLDLSAYDAVLIEYGASTSYSTHRGTMILKKDGNEWTISCFIIGSNAVRTRKVTVTASGITFAGGNQGTSTNNTAAIPTRIYGIKCIPL